MLRQILRTSTALAGLMISSYAAHAQTVAITGGTVFTASGTTIQNGTVLIRDGRITAVGTNVNVPAGVRTIDARGKWVTPGLIDASTRTGLVEIGAVQNTVESSNSTGPFTASFNVLEGINPASQLIPVTRIEGVTTVNAAPTGGLIPGQSVVVDLDGDRIEDMVVMSPAALMINISSTGAVGGSRAGVAAMLRTLFDDAREYDARRSDYDRGQMRALAADAADLDALLPALRGEIPVMFSASRRSDIETALRLAAEYNLRAVITGGIEAWQVAETLAARDVPAVIDPTSNIPRYGGLSARLDNAALLESGGVTVVISTFGGHQVRNIRQLAGNAVGHGMSHEGALRAITINPARMLGLNGYGAIEIGSVANIVVWSGDPLELSTAAEYVFIRGTEIPMTSRQRQLLNRYRSLPPGD